MKTKESCHSPFYKLGAFGHIPFEYSGEVYRMNPTVTMVETVLDLINDKEKAFLKSNKPSFSSLPNLTL